MDKNSWRVTFWGVRGSRPVPGPRTLKYGGNTACVELVIGGRRIILDAGTGICELGRLLEAEKEVKAAILISHVHWDHVWGLPFFTPLYRPGNCFHLYGEPKKDSSFEDRIGFVMSDPHFPVQIQLIRNQMQFTEVRPGETFELIDGIFVSTFRANHPNGSISYRIDAHGNSVCYIVDHEHTPYLDPALVAFVKNTDVLIYDANYTDEEYAGKNGLPSRVGWGHSTWQEAVKLAEAAAVKGLYLFHHDQYRSDEELDRILEQARRDFSSTHAAVEGQTLILREGEKR